MEVISQWPQKRRTKGERGVPLCYSLITPWPEDHPSTIPLKFSSSSPVFWGAMERDEEWRSELAWSSALYLPKTGECQEAGSLVSTVLSVSRGDLGWVHLEWHRQVFRANVEGTPADNGPNLTQCESSMTDLQKGAGVWGEELSQAWPTYL